MRALAAITLLSTLTLGAGAALAQPARDAQVDAEGHYETALRLYNEGRYRDSVEAFDRAIGVRPDAVFFCNRAVPLLKLDELSQALASLEQCRDRYADQPAEQAQIDAQAKALGLFVRVVRPQAREIARAMSAPAPAPAPAPTQALGDDAPKRRGWRLRDTGYVGAGVGVALLASALTVDLISADLVTQYQDASRGEDRAAYEQLRADVQQRQRLFWGLAGAGGALVLISAGLISYDMATDTSAASIGVALQPGGAAVMVRGRF